MQKTQTEMLEKNAVTELQQILADEYGQSLTLEETERIGNQLVNLYSGLLMKNKNYDGTSTTKPARP